MSAGHVDPAPGRGGGPTRRTVPASPPRDLSAYAMNGRATFTRAARRPQEWSPPAQRQQQQQQRPAPEPAPHATFTPSSNQRLLASHRELTATPVPTRAPASPLSSRPRTGKTGIASSPKSAPPAQKTRQRDVSPTAMAGNGQPPPPPVYYYSPGRTERASGGPQGGSQRLPSGSPSHRRSGVFGVLEGARSESSVFEAQHSSRSHERGLPLTAGEARFGAGWLSADQPPAAPLADEAPTEEVDDASNQYRDAFWASAADVRRSFLDADPSYLEHRATGRNAMRMLNGPATPLSVSGGNDSAMNLSQTHDRRRLLDEEDAFGPEVHEEGSVDDEDLTAVAPFGLPGFAGHRGAGCGSSGGGSGRASSDEFLLKSPAEDRAERTRRKSLDAGAPAFPALLPSLASMGAIDADSSSSDGPAKRSREDESSRPADSSTTASRQKNYSHGRLYDSGHTHSHGGRICGACKLPPQPEALKKRTHSLSSAPFVSATGRPMHEPRVQPLEHADSVATSRRGSNASNASTGASRKKKKKADPGKTPLPPGSPVARRDSAASAHSAGASKKAGRRSSNSPPPHSEAPVDRKDSAASHQSGGVSKKAGRGSSKSPLPAHSEPPVDRKDSAASHQSGGASKKASPPKKAGRRASNSQPVDRKDSAVVASRRDSNASNHSAGVSKKAGRRSSNSPLPTTHSEPVDRKDSVASRRDSNASNHSAGVSKKAGRRVSKEAKPLAPGSPQGSPTSPPGDRRGSDASRRDSNASSYSTGVAKRTARKSKPKLPPGSPGSPLSSPRMAHATPPLPPRRAASFKPTASEDFAAPHSPLLRRPASFTGDAVAPKKAPAVTPRATAFNSKSKRYAHTKKYDASGKIKAAAKAAKKKAKKKADAGSDASAGDGNESDGLLRVAQTGPTLSNPELSRTVPADPSAARAGLARRSETESGEEDEEGEEDEDVMSWTDKFSGFAGKGLELREGSDLSLASCQSPTRNNSRAPSRGGSARWTSVQSAQEGPATFTPQSQPLMQHVSLQHLEGDVAQYSAPDDAASHTGSYEGSPHSVEASPKTKSSSWRLFG
ncbi:hypothetical protein DIPPA_16018 [Diplonema papillatum]|nr:hypothetical protein DIPPA_16018 [Diplonema papillatum]